MLFCTKELGVIKKFREHKLNIITLLACQMLDHLPKKALLALSNHKINAFLPHQTYRTVSRHFISAEYMLTYFLPDLLRKYLYQATNIYG